MDREELQRKLWLLESLERINKIIFRRGITREVFLQLLKEMTEILGCDRAWMIHPCDPEAESFSIPYEHTRPGLEGLGLHGGQVFMDDAMRESFRIYLEAPGPVTKGPGSTLSFSPGSSHPEAMCIRSQMCMALRPFSGDPWLLGVHQCTRERTWTEEEIHLFEILCQRINEGLSMLLHQDALESEDHAVVEALRRNQERLDLAVEGTGGGVWELVLPEDLSSGEPPWLAHVSPYILEWFGFDPEKEPPPWVEWTDRILPQDLELMVQEARDHLVGERPMLKSRFRIQAPSGEMRWIQIRAKAQRDSEGRPRRLVGMEWDITEEVRIEEASQRGQLLQSLGRLAGGIAHDFNNLLLGILGSASLIRQELPRDFELVECLDDIDSLVERGARLCAQMLAYSQKGHFTTGPLDLVSLLREMRPALEASLDRRVELRVDLPMERILAEVDEDHIRRSILDVVTNSMEAMEGLEGTISLQVGVQEEPELPGEGGIMVGEPPPGPVAFIEVADEGHGIDAPTLQRIFDPFFSTRFTGRGMGLPALQGCLIRHSGAVSVSSIPGKGTTVLLFLPLLEQEALPPREESSPPEEGPMEGTILLVEDDPYLNRLLSRFLRRWGFEVLSARHGREALVCFGEHSPEVSCILLDFVMPYLDGIQVLKTIRSKNPHLPILMMSGYPMDKDFIEGNHTAFIQKPYLPEDLLETLRELLNEEK